MVCSSAVAHAPDFCPPNPRPWAARSYKPQKISPKFEGTVRQLLHKKIRESYLHPQFNADVMKPMNIEVLMDQEVQVLSGEGARAHAGREGLHAGGAVPAR